MNFDINFKKVYIIAEMSANHNQNLQTAKQIVIEAKKCGADAVKIQTFHADTVTLDVKNNFFKIQGGTLWDGTYLFDLYNKAFLPWEWHKELFDLAKDINIDIFSTPTDKSSVDFLETLNCPIYKISSFEITDIPLIKYVASKGKPIIISTGIATIADIELAINTCIEEGNKDIILLKCTSEYPAKYVDMNLKTIQNLSETFGVVSGLSDHTKGYLAPVVATTLGAKVIEKHLILDSNDRSFDKEFSLNIEEFKQMVEAIRDTEKLIGQINYNQRSAKSQQFSRSIFIARDIKKGDIFTEDNIKVVRPSNGLHPKYYIEVIGKKASKDIKKGVPLSWEKII